MSYVEENLLPGEVVTFETRLHWIIFAAPVLLITFGVWMVRPAPVGIVIISIVWAILKWIDYATSEFAVTNRRVIIQVGFIRRRTLELQLQKVETVSVIRAFWAVFSAMET